MINIKRVKQGAKITWYNGIYMCLFGLYLIFFIRMNMKYTFKSTSELWGFFYKYSPDIAFIFILFNILSGVLLIANGIVVLYLSDFIFKRKEKMTWVVLFLFGILNWGGLLTICFFLKNIFLIFFSALGLLTFILGMFLPVQYYLEKPYREY